MYFCLKYKKYNRIIYRKLHFKDKIWIKIQYMEQKRHFLLTRTKNPCIIQYKGCESMIILQNGVISVGIEPYGAELSRIKNLRTNREFIWSGDSTYWSGQSPILFPIVGRLFGDSFEYGGEKYYLPKHGFARKSNFDIVRTEETEAQFRLCSSSDTKLVYPFDFQLDVGFSIVEKKLSVTYRVKNTGDIAMFFSIGAHPAFNCKMGDFIKFDEYETLETYTFDTSSFRTGTKPFMERRKNIEITEHLFDDDALVFSGMKSRGLEIISRGGSRIVRVDYGNAPYLGIWAKPGAPFVCIEPWFGINDAPEVSGNISEKEGILALEAGSEFEYTYKITVA